MILEKKAIHILGTNLFLNSIVRLASNDCSSQVLTVFQNIRFLGLRQTDLKVNVTIFEFAFFSFAEYVKSLHKAPEKGKIKVK